MTNALLITLFLIAAVDFTAGISSTTTTANNIISAAFNPTNATGAKYLISPHELDSLLRVLRYSGYPLFSNAIDTSDVQFEILTGQTTPLDSSSSSSAAAAAAAAEVIPEFTIFAPRDHFLYTLDMAADADAYVAALRSHIVPSRRLTVSQLRNLTSPYLDTLLPHYSILIGKSDNDDAFVTVDGVRVSDPNLYLGSRFAVHGLDGILLTGFNMYEDTLSQMGRGFFAPEKLDPSSRNSAAATVGESPVVKNGGFSRVMRKHRRLQYRRIWKSNYSARRSNDGGRAGEDDF